MKQTLTKVFQLAIALLIGGLAMTVYIQHRELAAQQTAALVPEHPGGYAFAPEMNNPMAQYPGGPTPTPTSSYVPLFPPPPVVRSAK